MHADIGYSNNKRFPEKQQQYESINLNNHIS